MFCDDFKQLAKVLPRASCTVLGLATEQVTPKLLTQLGLKDPYVVTPDDSKATQVITVEQIRELIAIASHRETSERYFVVHPADTMNEAAANAFLKTFEEPKPHYHFVLITANPSALLPTILSRAQVLYLRTTGQLDAAPATKPKIVSLAKTLISAAPRDLVSIANELTKTKTKPREQALTVVATAIELLYKSYFKTNNPKFLQKLPAMLTLYDHLEQNGHLKLHLVADLC